MKKISFLLVFIITCFGLSATTIQNEIQKLLVSDVDGNDKFGYTVDIDDNFAVVGAYLNNGSVNGSGSAYIYHKVNGTWNEQQKLVASDGQTSDNFGCAVAIDGDYVIIGAQQNDSNSIESGSAYIFHLDNGVWVEQQKIFASDGIYEGYFGISVSISGSHALVGCGHNSESVYTFYRQGSIWSEQQIITASDGQAGDYFGFALEVDDNIAVIGAKGDDDCSTNSGAVYVYNYIGGTWIFDEKLKVTEGFSYCSDRFGTSVTLGGGRIAIGAIGDDDNGSFAGATYIYKKILGEWQQIQKIIPTEIDGGDHFGSSVDISGNYLVIGADNFTADNVNSGGVFCYKLASDVFEKQFVMTASDGSPGDDLGCSVAISGKTIVSGAFLADDYGSNSGSAYIFEIEGYVPDPINEQIVIGVNDNTEHQFQNTALRLQFTGNHAGTAIDATKYFEKPLTIGQLPAGIVNIASNYWRVVSSAGNVGTYDLTFDLSGLEGIGDFNTLGFLKRDDADSAWQDVVADLGATLVYNYPYITIQGLSSFSEFVPAGGDDNSLPVTLSTFKAIRTNSNFVELNWITKSETDMSGYNILRCENSNLNGALKVNTSIVTASNLANEHNYTFTDDEVELNNTYYYWLESLAMSGNIEYYGPVTVSLDEEKAEEYNNLGIMGVYPNPFNPETKIDYSVKEETDVKISVYNMKGQRVKTLVEKSVSAGDHNIVWYGDSDSGSNVSSGVYFVKMVTGNHIETRKVVLMK